MSQVIGELISSDWSENLVHKRLSRHFILVHERVRSTTVPVPASGHRLCLTKFGLLINYLTVGKVTY